jgi:probable HAF family extracellular repeat protein
VDWDFGINPRISTKRLQIIAKSLTSHVPHMAHSEPEPKNTTRIMAKEPTIMNLAFSNRIGGAALIAALAVSTNMVAQQQGQSKNLPPSRYILRDLGTLPGGTFSQAAGVTGYGLVFGVSTVSDGTQHAALWFEGHKYDIGTPGLGGANSAGFGINLWAEVAGQGETSTADPNGENFCGYGTGMKCQPFRWQDGKTTRLSLLGGNNGTVNNINNRGDVSGVAETGRRDSACPAGVAVNGTGPQFLDFEAVIWNGGQKAPRELRPLAGDTVGEAFWINDNGLAVGTTGLCSTTQLPPFAAGAHAVLWDNYGSPHDLGNLGGTANPAIRGIGNIAFAINNRDHVVGASALAGDANDEAFLWTKETGMVPLGRLDGDTNSAGLSINNKDEVVGGSINGDLLTGDAHPFLWKNGVMAPLSSLLPPDSDLIPLIANAINDDGEIAGFGFQPSSQEIHAFLAIPCDRTNTNKQWCKEDHGGYSGQPISADKPKATLSEDARRRLQRLRHR